MAIVVSAILIVLHQPQTQPKLLDPNDIAEEYSAPLLVKLAAPLKPTGAGMGAGSKGRVGTANGGGEGSETEFRRARGGGGSGDREELPPQKGQLFQASKIPAIAPEVFLSKNPALPSGGINIDPKLLQDQKLVQYGDPRSLSSAASRGPGSGGNYGTGNGPGAGEGDGDGFGEGENGNSGEGKNEPGGGGEGGQFGNRLDDPNRILRIPEVTQRPKVLAKPEPQYTEDARRAATVGTVVLRVVFSHSGQVTNIRAITTLPFGLTERAIAAARQIRFLPALKGGRPVSVYIQLEYNFNLY
jgi:protein TonB